MKYDSQLYDLPIVDRLTGELVGYMRGVVMKPGKKRLEGIVFEERGWLRRCHFVPWNAVTAMGEKSIIVDSEKKNRASRNVVCPGRENKVYDSGGGFLGHISNYLIDERTGDVLGMELSASVVDDLKFGRKIIANAGNIMKAEDFLMLTGEKDEGTTEHYERRSEDEGLF